MSSEGVQTWFLHVGHRLGSALVGGTVMEVGPGYRGPYHLHHGNEELVLVSEAACLFGIRGASGARAWRRRSLPARPGRAARARERSAEPARSAPLVQRPSRRDRAARGGSRGRLCGRCADDGTRRALRGVLPAWRRGAGVTLSSRGRVARGGHGHGAGYDPRRTARRDTARGRARRVSGLGAAGAVGRGRARERHARARARGRRVHWYAWRRRSAPTTASGSKAGTPGLTRARASSRRACAARRAWST